MISEHHDHATRSDKVQSWDVLRISFSMLNQSQNCASGEFKSTTSI